MLAIRQRKKLVLAPLISKTSFLVFLGWWYHREKFNIFEQSLDHNLVNVTIFVNQQKLVSLPKMNFLINDQKWNRLILKLKVHYTFVPQNCFFLFPTLETI